MGWATTIILGRADVNCNLPVHYLLGTSTVMKVVLRDGARVPPRLLEDRQAAGRRLTELSREYLLWDTELCDTEQGKPRA